MNRLLNHRFMSRRNEVASGFTIVELLIVIVIIAILATITVIAYKGIQDKAYATKGAAVAESYANLATMYDLDNGTYPERSDGPVNGGICLGTAADYPANSDFAEGQCSSSSEWGDRYIDTGFNSSLKPYSSVIPSGSISTVTDTNTGDKFRGAIYHTNEWNDWSTHIHYFLKGDQTCPKGVAYQYDNITECIVNLNGDAFNDSAQGGEG
ncbi:MAG: prepilin-type N-terminal cleavage/methylation domain-containing protein [Candidatus Saccharimonas sp.]